MQISAFSQKWADELEKAGKMSHQDLQQAIFNAENVCCEIMGGTASVTVSFAVDSFYKEVEQYDFNNPNPTMANMHFRNMIWKNSKKLGVGCTDSKVRSSLPKSKNLEFLKYHCDPPCFTQLVFCELDCTGCISLTCLRCFFLQIVFHPVCVQLQAKWVEQQPAKPSGTESQCLTCNCLKPELQNVKNI